MDFKIVFALATTLGLAVSSRATAVAQTASAPTAGASAEANKAGAAPLASPPAPSPVPPPAPPGVAGPEAPAAVTPTPTVPSAPPPTAPVASGPKLELPEESAALAPAVALPRESPIENALGPSAAALSGTAIGGYGELTLNAPSKGPALVDLRRFVLFVGHNFTDRIRFYSEVEVEHAVSSADDQGEVEIEQAYLDGLLLRGINVRGGLLLMPVGIINVYHEPPTFNGVDRPDVDLYVIPSTWREPGLGIFGELATGLRYQLFLVNGFNANGFSAQSFVAEGHQEGQLAAARDFGGVGRLDYEPRLGTNLGASFYYATAGNSLRSTVGKVPVTMIEADARTKLGGFSARAEFAISFLGDAAALNRALQAGDEEQRAAGPVSSRAQGGYLDVGYDVLRFLAPGTTQNLTLFGRYDYVNTQAAVPAGYQAIKAFSRQTATVGLVYRPIMNIGLKLDLKRLVPAEGENGHEVAAAITWMF